MNRHGLALFLQILIHGSWFALVGFSNRAFVCFFGGLSDEFPVLHSVRHPALRLGTLALVRAKLLIVT